MYIVHVVKKNAEDTGLVHFHLGVGGEHAVVPHSLGQAGHHY